MNDPITRTTEVTNARVSKIIGNVLEGGGGGLAMSMSGARRRERRVSRRGSRGKGGGIMGGSSRGGSSGAVLGANSVRAAGPTSSSALISGMSGVHSSGAASVVSWGSARTTV